MNRTSSALLGALLTLSLIPTAACVGEMDESSVDPAEEVETDSELLKVGGEPAGALVLQHREMKRVDEDGNEQQDLAASPSQQGFAAAPSQQDFVAAPSYAASGTNNATVNTVNYNVGLNAGETFTIGTCGLAGAASSGDTYLRIYNPFGGEVASNDDACGSASSNIVYTVPTTGTYQVRAGCFSNGACSGTLAYSFSSPLFSYSASNTNNGTVNTTNLSLNIGSFTSMKFGTCGIPGASGSGDTYLRLYNSSNILVASNDDACGALSQLVFSGGSLSPGMYSLRAGCYGSGSCSGTVAYSVE
jgi:hypothetical protein